MHNESPEKEKYVTDEPTTEDVLLVSLQTKGKQFPLGHVMLLHREETRNSGTI